MGRYNSVIYFVKIANYSFFNQSTKLKLIPTNKNSIKNLIRCYSSSECGSPTDTNTKPSIIESVDELDLYNYGSAIKGKFNFAMYANKSPIIQQYIDLGVNLYEVQKNPRAANYLLTLNCEKIKRYLMFLTDNGVSADKLGHFITKNPLIFKENLSDLEVRINYLTSKKFDKEMISTIITRNPRWLSVPVKKIDERLGYIQTTFDLKGDQIRKMITEVPSLALIKQETIKINTYTLKEELNLDKYILKKVVVSEPRLLRLSSFDLVLTYEYLTKTMKVSKELIILQPKALTYRKFIFEERHKFLESLGKAQYCHLLPGYVNLLSMVETTNSEFCEKIAKTSEKLFNEYLKTL